LRVDLGVTALAARLLLGATSQRDRSIGPGADGR
jgi:hypothetical protein